MMTKDNKPISLTTPLTDEAVSALRSGDRVALSGVVYTARDAAHRRMIDGLERGEPLPFDVRGQVLYFVGPTPPPPGRAVGSAGPTTAGRMDRWSPRLIAMGLKGMIGKGPRSQEVRDACVAHKCVYFAATGGAGALLASYIRKAEVIAWPDLGTEAVHRLEVAGLPVIVINDIHGGDLYKTGPEAYRIE